MKNIVKKKTESTSNFVYRALKDMIMNLELKPGAVFNEIEICKELNVSRTPVREAIIRLTEEKLVTIFPQKGLIVSKIDLALVEEAVFMRVLCETEVIKEICQYGLCDDLIKELEKNIKYQEINLKYENNYYEFYQLDNEFHKIIFEYAGKPNTWEIINKFSNHFNRLRLIDVFEKKNLRKSLEEHIEIINILKNKKVKKIDNFLLKNMTKYKKEIENLKIKYPNYFE